MKQKTTNMTTDKKWSRWAGNDIVKSPFPIGKA